MKQIEPVERQIRQVIAAGGFFPRKLESVKYAGITFKGYPEVDSSCPPGELVFLLLTNKALAEAQRLHPTQVLDFCAGRCGLENNARIASQWTGRLSAKWCDPGSLAVITYRNSLGEVIDNAIDPGTSKLRDITDSTVDKGRPEDVAFVRVRLDLDFQSLHFEEKECKIFFEYFIPLPVGPIEFVNGGGGVTRRVTCTIAGDPFDLSIDEFKRQIVTPLGVLGPALLKEPTTGMAVCTPEYTHCARDMHDRIIAMASESIFHKLREQLVPGFSASPSSTVEKIHQCYTDSDGNEQCLKVIDYFNAILRGSAPFLDLETFLYNIATHFVTYLEPNIKAKFDLKTKDHLSFTDLSRDAQLKRLDIFLAIATQCQEDVTSATKLVCKAMGDRHSFFKQVLRGCNLPLPDPNEYSDPSSFISAAEKTLCAHRGQHHLSDEEIKILCWGCNQPHSWRDRRSKEITCPNKDKPGVREAAEKKHKQYLAQKKKARNGWVQKKKIKFDDLSPEETTRFREHLVNQATALSNARSNVTTATTPSASAGGGALLFSALVLLNNLKKPPLPAKIDNQLPFTTLTLGSIDTPAEQCPSIRALVDTGAGISTGYSNFWLPILKAHPDVVENIWTVADGNHSPIALGGIVTGKDGDMSHRTTELKVVVDVRLRYETNHGQAAVHSIALGDDVGVNIYRW